MGLKLVTPPEITPVTLEEAKAQLHVDHNYDNTLITSMVEAATISMENLLGRALMPQTWDFYRDDFPDPKCGQDRGIRLPLPPLISVGSVNYVDPDSETEVVWSSSNYEVDTTSLYGWVVPGVGGWPTPMQTINAVRVRFTAGYDGDSPGDIVVPAPIRHAILLITRDLYDHRGSFVVGVSVAPIPDAIERLTRDYRLVTI